jgi:hypothetical protein
MPPPPVLPKKKPDHILDEACGRLFYRGYDKNASTVRPDYAHKYFGEKRAAFVLLLFAVRADGPAGRAG